MISKQTGRKLLQAGKTSVSLMEKGLGLFHTVRGAAAAGSALYSAAAPYLTTAAAVAL